MPPPVKPGGKRLPLWAYLAAGAVGLVIGIFLLRNKEQAPEGEGSNEALDPTGRGGQGGGGAPPLLEDMLQGMGLVPPDDFGVGVGVDAFMGSDNDAGPSFDTSTYQGLRDYEAYYGDLPPGVYRRDPPGGQSSVYVPEPPSAPAPGAPPAPLPAPPSTAPPSYGGKVGAA